MKQIKVFAILLSLVSGALVSKSFVTDRVIAPDKTTVEGLVWYDISKVEDLQKQEARPVIVDVYTDWCKWCKVMDEKTFSDKTLADKLNEEYYMVKFNAETKDNVDYNGQTYSYQKAGRRGYNTLAAELCGERISYPSFVVLDDNLTVRKVIKGYKSAEDFRQVLDSTKI